MNKLQRLSHLKVFLFFTLLAGACTTSAQTSTISPTLTQASAMPTLLTITPTLSTATPSPTTTATLEQATVTTIEELTGIWQGSTGEETGHNYYWQFKADGTYTSDYQVVKSSQGIVLEKQYGKNLFDVEGNFNLEGGKLNLLDTGGLDTECGSVAGIYTVTLFKAGDQRLKIAFTAVDDACFPRRRSATAEAWILVPTEH